MKKWSYNTITFVNTTHFYLWNESNVRRFIWIIRTTFYFKTINPIFIWSLWMRVKQFFKFILIADEQKWKKYYTRGGPIIIPVHCVRVISESSWRPQEMVPSLTPFCPCSNSSKRRKFLGTTTADDRVN